MRSSHILVGSTQLKPLSQGKLSSMCGLYSILNALQLSLFPRRLVKPELQQVYLHAIAFLSRRRQLKRVLGTGMVYEVWDELRDELVAFTNKAFDVSLKPTPTLLGTAAIDRRRMIEKLKRDVHGGSPILAGFGGVLDHYSVICGYTPQRLLLFDSSGLAWIKADNLGLGEQSRRRHWILAECTSTLVDDW